MMEKFGSRPKEHRVHLTYHLEDLNSSASKTVAHYESQ